ncbi:MAG: DUF3052 domain-containing protein [Acidobacteriota bacterium]|nr:DUF3052 domain-containing protein [Acidobacteriota bacterium]
MAGHSGTALPRKLGIKPGQVVALIGEPSGWSVGELPDGVVVRRRAHAPLDLIVAFFSQRSRLERRLPTLTRALRNDGGLWIAWPRKAAGHVSDVNADYLRHLILPTGLVDIKVAALDHDWSALKFVWRRELRPGLPAPAPD